MSVHTTDPKHVALFDSVTGLAFGPTFDSDDDAHEFLAYVHSFGDDARELTASALLYRHTRWLDVGTVMRGACGACRGGWPMTPTSAAITNLLTQRDLARDLAAQLEAQTAAVAELHQPNDFGLGEDHHVRFCECCSTPWPCDTARAIGAGGLLDDAQIDLLDETGATPL